MEGAVASTENLRGVLFCFALMFSILNTPKCLFFHRKLFAISYLVKLFPVYQ